MAANKTLSLCIMTRDDSMISGCVQNMEGVVDEIIIADIGSGNCTATLVGQAGVTVYRLAWEDNFSRIKNFCMDHATKDWVLFLQADETIPTEQHKELRLLMQNPAAEGYLLDVEDTCERREECCPSQSLRLLRNRENYRFGYRSFEYIPDEQMYSILSGSIRIKRSLGNAPRWQQEERKRLLQMDLKERPFDGYVHYLQGVELLNQEKFKESAASLELARHGLCGGNLYAPHLYQCLGICFLALLRHTAAEKLLNEGIWLFPFYTDLMVLQAQNYHQLGRDAEALKALEDCLMIRSAANAGVPEPQIDIFTIEKMRDEIQAERE